LYCQITALLSLRAAFLLLAVLLLHHIQETADKIFRQLDRGGAGKITKKQFKDALLVHGGLRKASSRLSRGWGLHFQKNLGLPSYSCWRVCCCLMLAAFVFTALFWIYVIMAVVRGFTTQMDLTEAEVAGGLEL
jgi:hypothetical protein